MTEWLVVCHYDLLRRKIFEEIVHEGEYVYIKTTEGNVYPVSHTTEYSIPELIKICTTIPNCIFGIVSDDSSVVYYSISQFVLPTSVTFK
ncbi:tRNA-splicing endonuclease subunit Sen15 domain-containing protein [Entamoeba marina]